MNHARNIVLLTLGFLLLGILGGPSVAQDSKKETQLRTVRGAVTDKSDNPLPNSVVFLKNLRTNTIRSSFADAEGTFRFSGLDPNADYEIHAELDGTKSPTRSITSLDNRKEIVMNLKIDKKKS